MNQTKRLFLLVFVLLALHSIGQKNSKIKPTRWIATQVPEPSDICYNSKTDTFFVVSDDGILFETNIAGDILRKMPEANCDYEAVYADDNFVYAVDETHRTIHLYNPTTLKCSRIVNVPYQGGRNAGYEAFTYNKNNNAFILVSEKNPITLFELDANFNIKNQFDLSIIARDISSASFHNDFLWLLSDEDRTVLKLNPITYEVLEKRLLPVINPEGFAFDKDSNLVITCDDMQRIYYFNNLEIK
jgi:uncharacterized protein YjiK